MWEELPYKDLRDDRGTRLTKRSRLTQLIENAEDLRVLAWHPDGFLCQQELLLRAMPARFANFDIFFNDFDFEGMPESTEAFCDFLYGNHIHAREYLFGGVRRNPERQDDVSSILPHECGHIISGHRRPVSSRTRNITGQTHRRLAHSTRVLNGSKSYLRYYAEAKGNADLEEEADIVGVALQVPVMELDGSLSIPEVANLYRVPEWVSYYAALLARDYQRAKLLRSVGKIGEVN